MQVFYLGGIAMQFTEHSLELLIMDSSKTKDILTRLQGEEYE